MDKQRRIGELNEHTLHLALKNYLQPDCRFHEQPYRGYVADIMQGEEITEIETRSYTNVGKKLGVFLENRTVTVVSPIASVKRIVWIDPQDGSLTAKRLSPKKERPVDICRELYKLREFLTHPRFRLKLILVEVTEYKRRTRRRGRQSSEREERVPEAILGVLEFSSPADYAGLVEVIPTGEFTAAEFAERNRLKGRLAWYALAILRQTGVILPAGKRGKAFLYRRSEQPL